MVNHHFRLVLVSLLSRECWFPQFSPKAVWRICVVHIQLWAMWASIEDDHINRRPSSSPYHRVKGFLPASRITVRLIRRAGRRVFLHTVQGYHSRHPDRFPRLTPDHRCRVSLGCNNPLAFQQHDEKLGHAHYRCRGWPCTHLQIAHEASADGSSLGAYVPTCLGVGDGQESARGTDLDVWNEIRRLHVLNIFEPHEGTASSQSDQFHHDSGRTLREKIFHLLIRIKARSSFDVIVFNRYPCSPWVRVLLSRTQRKTF